MDATQLIGFLAALLTTAANIPQTYIIIRDKSAKHVSVVTYSILCAGTALWLVYGIVKSDWPLIICNGISTLTCVLILALNFMPQRAINKLHTKVIPENIKAEKKRQPKSR